MPERTRAARQAVLKAWKREQQLVNEGKGTYDWTPEQQKSILDTGIAYDEDGYAFQGHHMQSVEKFPQYQGDPENIQFLSKADHLKAHDGWYGYLTNWYYNPVTGEKELFQDDKFSPCPIVLLSDPIPRENYDEQACPDNMDAVSNAEGDSVQDTTDASQDNASPKSQEEDGGDPELERIKKQIEEWKAQREKDKAREAEKAAYYEAMLKEKEEREQRSVRARLNRWLDNLSITHPIISRAGKFLTNKLVPALIEATIEETQKQTMRYIYSPRPPIQKNNDSQSTKTVITAAPTDDSPKLPDENAGNATRAAPIKHDVSGHSQRYHTKDGVIWKEKKPFPRPK